MTDPPTKKRRKKLPHWADGWVDPLTYAVVRAGAALINIAGADHSMRALRSAGSLYARSSINRRRLRRAAENISMCFPDWEKGKVDAYAIEAHRHLFYLAAEIALTPRLITPDGYAAQVELGELRPALRALSGETPCLFITGHCGNWEILGYTLATLGFPMHALFRPLEPAALDAWAQEVRRRRGLELIDKFGAARELPLLIQEKVPVGFIADQNAGDRGIFVPFFNRLASTYKTIGLMALQYGATIVCGQARRLAGPNAADLPAPRLADFDLGSRRSPCFRYRIDIVDIFGPDDWAHAPDPLFYITARYRRALEVMIRRAPEQNLWMHRFWKSRPPHERRGAPFPGQLREKIAALPWVDEDDVLCIVERSARDAAAIAAHHHP